MASFGCIVGVTIVGVAMVSRVAAFPRSRSHWRVEMQRHAKVPALLVVRLLEQESSCFQPPHHHHHHSPSIPSLHPVILGIYSWPPSVYYLNYLFREMRSLHDSETGFYL